MTDFLEFLKNIPSKKPIIVSGHIRPDGDSIGSQIALTRTLQKIGLEAYMAYDPLSAPKRLMPFIENTPLLHLNTQLDISLYTLIAVDTADKKRLPDLLQSQPVYALFDHHRSTKPYAEFNFIIPDAPSTTAILAEFIINASLEIDTCTAQALYLGLLTDTGQFSYPSTTPQTLYLAAQLVEKGAHPERITNQLFGNETLNRLTLRQRFLQTLKLELNKQVCIGFIDQTMYEETNTLPEDSEGFVDYTRIIEGVKIGVLIETNNTDIKVSLRSQEPEQALDMLATQFGGGGHACAAGFKIQSSLSNFYPHFLNTVSKHLSR
jgi:phosphoesterase RecJ-like protein